MVSFRYKKVKKMFELEKICYLWEGKSSRT